MSSLPWAFLGFSIPAFGEDVLVFADRSDHDNGVTPAVALPDYLVGREYIANRDGNKANAGFQLNVTVPSHSVVYQLIDNRVGDGDSADPPDLKAAMNWVWAHGFHPSRTGCNRQADRSIPDEIGIDENSTGHGIGPGQSIDNYASVYFKIVEAGTFSLYAQGEGIDRHFYGVVVAAGGAPGRVEQQLISSPPPPPRDSYRVWPSIPPADCPFPNSHDLARYPCGSLLHDGVWYSGTYCLHPAGSFLRDGIRYNLPWLGPLVGFCSSVDNGAASASRLICQYPLQVHQPGRPDGRAVLLREFQHPPNRCSLQLHPARLGRRNVPPGSSAARAGRPNRASYPAR